MLEMIPEGHPLEGMRLKLARAEEHLVAFDSQVADFLEREPYRVSYERKPDGREHVYRVNVAEQPPLALSVVIGDCLQNMRSALDHLAWQLAILSGKRTTPRRQTAFPVCDTTGAWTAKGTKDKVADLTAEHRARIKELQPFKISEPKRHRLWHLNELARVDRHRTLHVIGAVQQATNLVAGRRDDNGNFVGLTGRFTPSGTVNYAPFKDGAKIATFRLDPADPNTDTSNVEVQADFAFKIAFSQDVGIVPAYGVADILDNILRHIETKVIPPFFEPFGIVV